MRMRSQRSYLETAPSRVLNLLCQRLRSAFSLWVELPLHGPFEKFLRGSVSLLCHLVTLTSALSHDSTLLQDEVGWVEIHSVDLNARRA